MYVFITSTISNGEANDKPCGGMEGRTKSKSHFAGNSFNLDVIGDA